MRNVALAVLLAVSAACKRPSVLAPESSGPSAQLAMPARSNEKHPVPDEIKKLDALVDAEQRLAEKNRRLMVTPAPADFTPEAAARKIRLRLVLERTKIRVGESPRFRLEMTNVGREPLEYVEYDNSVFRWGGLLDSLRTIKFMLTDAKGRSHRLEPAMGGRSTPLIPRAGPPTLEQEAESSASTTFQVRILSGETLRSLGDGDSPSEPFRTMVVRNEFKTPGRYRIHVELDDRPRPLTQTYIEMALHYKTLDAIHKDHAEQVANALGPLSTETVVLEVVR